MGDVLLVLPAECVAIMSDPKNSLRHTGCSSSIDPWGYALAEKDCQFFVLGPQPAIAYRRMTHEYQTPTREPWH